MSDRRERSLLVVGAAGFIGRQVIRSLAAHGRLLAVRARGSEQLELLVPAARWAVPGYSVTDLR
jgi:uncharacterized protein YbjT (DUF2867 family)